MMVEAADLVCICDTLVPGDGRRCGYCNKTSEQLVVTSKAGGTDMALKMKEREELAAKVESYMINDLNLKSFEDRNKVAARVYRNVHEKLVDKQSNAPAKK